MSHLAFVSTELAPQAPGGAGFLLEELRSRLVDAGHRVSIVLVADEVDGDPGEGVHLAHGDDAAGWDLSFMARSKAAAEQLARLHAEEPIDHIEIQDFDGLGFWALTHRRDLGISEIPISVRFHGPVDLQIEAMGAATDDLEAVAVMEREVFSMADRILVPSPGIKDLVLDRYVVEPDRVLVAPPPVRTVAVEQQWRPGGDSFLVIGRLGEVKGSHDMVRAALPVLEDHPELSVVFAGSDGWSASEARPMREWLEELIPDDLTSRFTFTGQLDRAGLAERIATCRAVVVPSRFESFNLAAHEARRMGAPVIVPDIAAFRDLLDAGTGAIVFDGTVEGLRSALMAAAGDDGLLASVAARPAPPEGRWEGPYEAIDVEPWHLRSQGGMATAAIARLEAAWLEPRRRPPESMGRRLLRRVPDGLYGSVKRLVPNAVKDRIKAATDLGIEADRRRWEERFDRAVARVASMDAAEGPANVSVVIPCYNQGGFVREAVLSVFEQTDGGFEVIIVDDGSDDGTTTPLLASLELPRVTVIHQDNRGLPAARNAGIARSRAEYVVTLDADDMLVDTYVETLRRALDADPGAAYAHCWAELVGDTHMIWATRPFNRYQLMLSNSVVGCVMMRRAAWEAVGGYDETMRTGNEDWDLWIRLMAGGYGQVQIRDPLFRYRKHGVSMSVETESRYEAALADRVHRHPDLYSVGYLTRLKEQDYPLVSLVVDDGSPVREAPSGEVQLVRRGGRTLPEALGDVRGKYVTYLPDGTSVTLGDVHDACAMLESMPEVGVICSSSDDPVTVVRTWSVFDPDAPSAIAEGWCDASAPMRLSPGDHPDQRWMVPGSINDLPVLRQRPEEAGRLPDWVLT